MPRKAPAATAPAFVATAIAGVCAIAAVWGASAIGRPSNLDDRVTTASRNLEVGRRAVRAAKAPNTYPRGAVCAEASDAAIERLRRQIATQSAGLGVELTAFEAAPGAMAGGLSTLDLRLDLRGPYEGTLELLKRMEELRPMVFLDTADLTSKAAFVTLSLSGRAFCSAPR